MQELINSSTSPHLLYMQLKLNILGNTIEHTLQYQLTDTPVPVNRYWKRYCMAL